MLKILTIGNSFSDDAMEYVYQIARSAGVENIKFGNLYIGGCSLDMHLSQAQNNGGRYEYRENDNGVWKTTADFSSKDAIIGDKWDFISLQQSSGDSGMTSTYGNLQALIDYVLENANPEARLVWHMTWAYQQNSTHPAFSNYGLNQLTMYSQIINAVKICVLSKKEITALIPSGTALQNARTSSLGDNLTRDGYHLSFKEGRYIAGLTLFHSLTGISITDLEYAPAGVPEEVRKICIEAASTAVISPFNVTQLTSR